MSEEYRKNLIRFCHLAYERNLVTASDGNFSCRLPDGGMLITPSGRNKGLISEPDLIKLDSNGHVIGGGKASKELPLHMCVYEERQDAGVVFHSHPVFGTVFASMQIHSIPCDYFAEFPLFLKSVPIAPYAPAGSQALAESVRSLVHSSRNILLKNHGVLVFDSDFEAAFNRLEILENTLKMIFLLNMAGNVDPIDEENMKLLMK